MHHYTYKGRTMNSSQWAKEFGCSRQNLDQLFNRHKGEDPELILAHLDKSNPFYFKRAKNKTSKKKVTKENIYNFIYEYVIRHQYSPSQQEISEGVGASNYIVSRYLWELIAEGKIETDHRCAGRTYRVPELVVIPREEIKDEWNT